MDPFSYSKAIVCGVPASLVEAAQRLCEPDNPVDLSKAREQHNQYVDALKSLGIAVTEIPVDERYPDCVFVEDPVVVCGETALITIPGHPSREGEAIAIKMVAYRAGLTIVEMNRPGRMDGGDVLFTGREFFVGISQRTNEEGVDQLMSTFPEYPVTKIPVQEGLHLKSFCSMAGLDVIAIGQSAAAKSAQELMISGGMVQYQFVPVNDDIAANCVFANGTLIHSSPDVFPNSANAYDQLGCPRIPLSASELNKVDGCFTCCSVLIR